MTKRQQIKLTLFLALIGTAALAAPKPPGQHLNVTEVTADIGAGTLTITGEDFNVGPGPLDVALGEFGSLAITFSGATLIDALLPVGIPAGDYLLTVSTGNGQSQSDEYDLTIGAVGPEGPTGPPGVSGYQVVTNTSADNTVAYKTVSVACPAGKVLLGGGAGIFWGLGGGVVNPNTTLVPKLVSSFRFGGANTWLAEAQGIGVSSAWRLEVQAFCASF